MYFSNLDLQSEYIITSRINVKSMPDRNVNVGAVSRRQGGKYLGNEFGNKTISIEGYIKAPTASGLLGLVDEFQRYLALPEQPLSIDTGRTYIVTCTKCEISELNYTQSLVPFTVDFITVDPFALGSSLTAEFYIPSSVLSLTVPFTVSGVVYSEPTITFTTVSGAGDSGVRAITVSHINSGYEVNISGIFSKGVSSVFDFDNHLVTVSGILKDFIGAFSRFDIGSNSLLITVSGNNNYGIRGAISYRPRYF